MGQISIVSPEVRKALDGEKFRSNGVKRSVWVGDYLYTEFIHGQITRFNRKLTGVKVRERAEIHGFEQKLGDACAVGAAEFPDVRARVAEAFRRQSELIEHLESGGDDWNPPRTNGGGSGPSTEADLREIIERAYPGEADELVELSLADAGGDAAAACKTWAATEEGRRAWVDIQAERRARAAANLPKADDLLARLRAKREG